MIKKEEDRRIVKTRQVIQDALFALMQEKSYPKITIQDIIDRANVGRSTFYSHYETKEDLLLSCIEHLLKGLKQYIIYYLETGNDENRLPPVEGLFEHLKENSKPIKGLMMAESSELFFDKVRTYWIRNIEDYLKGRLPEGAKTQVPVELLSYHIVSTLISLIKWWITNKMPYSPQQMDHYFQELINPCIDSIIKNIHTIKPGGSSVN